MSHAHGVAALTAFSFLAVFGLPPAAAASDEPIEGTVQQVDAAGLSITILTSSGDERKLDLLKKVKVSVNGEEAELGGIRRGHKVKLTYNGDLEVVTRIEATGDVAPDPELVVLDELPDSNQSRGSPWLSEDGLTLYWKAVPPGDMQAWIWKATRKSVQDLFEGTQKVIPGNDPTVTGDGLEMIVLAKERLLSAKRPTAQDAFQRPQAIPELQSFGFLAAPCLSSDGLKMYADRIDFEKRKVDVVLLTRNARTARWGEPVAVKFTGWDADRQRFFHVTPDGKYGLASLQDAKGEWESSRLVVWSADRSGAAFHSPRFVEIGGKPVRGKFPRYAPATAELFFVSRRAGTTIEEIAVLRGFHPEQHGRAPSAEETAAQAAAKEAHNEALTALQGEWLTTREETNGKALTPAETRTTNRRITIDGEAFTMTRTTGGKPGTYKGEFDIDPAQRHFNFRGTGPQGAIVQFRGIYEVEGETLKLCYRYVQDDQTPRPADFTSLPVGATPCVFITLKRTKAADAAPDRKAPGTKSGPAGKAGRTETAPPRRLPATSAKAGNADEITFSRDRVVIRQSVRVNPGTSSPTPTPTTTASFP